MNADHGEENTPRNYPLFTEQTFWAVSSFNTLDLMENKLVYAREQI